MYLLKSRVFASAAATMIRPGEGNPMARTASGRSSDIRTARVSMCHCTEAFVLTRERRVVTAEQAGMHAFNSRCPCFNCAHV
jgi:hypothetical protein